MTTIRLYIDETEKIDDLLEKADFGHKSCASLTMNRLGLRGAALENPHNALIHFGKYMPKELREECLNSLDRNDMQTILLYYKEIDLSFKERWQLWKAGNCALWHLKQVFFPSIRI